MDLYNRTDLMVEGVDQFIEEDSVEDHDIVKPLFNKKEQRQNSKCSSGKSR